jgi:DNA-binding CsgD family transcriptional regulator/ligand-binding sensor protein
MTYKLSQLLDVGQVQKFTDLLHKTTGISISVVNPDGTVLADSGMQEICRHFHRVSPETRQHCRRSGTNIAFKPITGREYSIEKCKNGLVDAAAPITVLGQYAGNLVAGQFLVEQPDIEFFKRQALRSGFDESRYIKSLSKVPVIDEGKLRAFLRCFSILTGMLGDAGAGRLVDEMDRRKQVEASLDVQSRTLEEVNTTLRVLLNQREEDKNELEENILSNVKDLVLPYVEQLKKSELPAEQTSTIDIIEANLKKITSPMIRKIETFGLTAREISVASLLKEGKTTRHIADLLNISPKAVEFHRYNIRKKLGLDHKKTNLTSYLLSIA